MTKTELTVWTFSDKEIGELKPIFEQEFEINLIRDYENDWEWIWNGSQPKNKINISREHNWKTGEFSKPLRIKLTWDISELQRDELLDKIQKVLKSDLHFGTISNRGINLEDYKITKTIKYET
jgi:hypothetical protein